MPEVLSNFLKSLSRHDADLVWAWLDGSPDAVHEMIELVGVPGVADELEQ